MIRVLRAAMPSSTAAAAAAAADPTSYISSRQPAVSERCRQLTTMDAFLEPGKCSRPPTSDFLRGSFDAALDRAPQGDTLQGESARHASTGSPCGRTARVPTTPEVPVQTSPAIAISPCVSCYEPPYTPYACAAAVRVIAQVRYLLLLHIYI